MSRGYPILSRRVGPLSAARARANGATAPESTPGAEILVRGPEPAIANRCALKPCLTPSPCALARHWIPFANPLGERMYPINLSFERASNEANGLDGQLTPATKIKWFRSTAFRIS